MLRKMSSNGHDIQVCVCKSLKLLSNICVTFTLKHPFYSLSMLCFFLLYIVFPLVFWVLVYSIPLVVCTGVILSFPFNAKTRSGDVETNDNKNRQATHEPAEDKGKKPLARVHSVRRRRAKEFARDVEDNNKTQQRVDDKNEVLNHQVVIDKNALVTEENSPKDIREVEIVQDYSIDNSTKSRSCSASQSPKHKYDESEYQTLNDGKEIGNNNSNIIIINKAALQGNEDDNHQKNKMDYAGILDSERTKRLESLIARRRSRKLLSLEVRRSLMNKGKNHDYSQIASILAPKINNTPSRLVIPRNASVGSLRSPSPGSAPSVLVPMRNPFDLPYDPQEEKPDLTGDGFAKEFMPPVSNIGRDGMFCRHESFSLGPTFLRPGEYDNRNLKQTSLDSRLRQTAFSSSYSSSSFIVYNQFPGKEFDREFSPIMEHESKPSIGRLDDDDHIKEIIQVHGNGSEDDGDINDDREVQTRATREDASWRSSSSSEEDDAPVFKINREAILKSLSSMPRQNALPEETLINNNEQIGEHLSQLKDRFYYSDRLTTTRHGAASHSIASDLQVEVSEISSPPLTIDENLSYPDYDDEDSRSNADSWGLFDLSQVDEYESRFLVQVPEDTALPIEPQCAHPWCSITEFPDSCQTTRATNLDEMIDKTLQRSASLLAQTPKRNDSIKRAEANAVDVIHENNTNETEESSTIEPTMASDERLEPDHRELITGSTIVEEQIDLGSMQHSEGEQSSSEAIVSVTHGAIRSNNNNIINNNAHEAPISNNLMPNVAFNLAQSSPSPKSVLHPTCSVGSLDHYMDDEAQQFNARVLLSPDPLVVSSSGGRVRGLEHESSETSNTSTTENEEQHEILENGVKPEEVACGSSQVAAEPTEDTSSTSINNDEMSSKNKN